MMSTQATRPETVTEKTWEDFLTLRKAKKAPLTETALEGIEREARKAGILLEEALRTCCEMGWQGFRAQWYERNCRPVRTMPGMTYAEIDKRMRMERWEQMTGQVHPDRFIGGGVIVDVTAG